MDFYKLVEKYQKLNIIPSKEAFDDLKIKFVFLSNKLEGSALTLIQTKEIIDSHKFVGEGSLIDGLMAIDHYRALNNALLFGSNKYPLSENIILNLHKTLLKNTFEIDPFYNNWISKGQKLGEYKIQSNRILFQNGNEKKYYQTPSPIESKRFILDSIDAYNNSTDEFLTKLSKLVQNVYNAHAFFDGNKRMTRLIIANQLFSNNLPLMLPHSIKSNYNNALMEGFLNNNHEPILKIIETSFCQQLQEQIELNSKLPKTKRKGFGLIL